MLNNILNLEGVKKLNHKEQRSILAGHCSTCPDSEFQKCLATCSGHCAPNGTCYQILH
ncbi:hypothetical protein [Aquimarina litoralis]|uniref:hypothetical protein n=1 Tax=Aquimarina litoralis TaxID=584605 RepID=UPI001C569C7B|nr:hypothetical protein [Aquimarina litoralis]